MTTMPTPTTETESTPTRRAVAELRGVRKVYYKPDGSVMVEALRGIDLTITEGESIATAFEVGIHNATLAIVVAQSVLLSVEMSLPAAIYGVLMFFIAAGFGFLIKRRAARSAEPVAA